MLTKFECFHLRSLKFHLGILIFVYINNIIAAYTMKMYAVIKIQEIHVTKERF